MDSLGVGVIEIGCKSAPDRRLQLPGSTDMRSDDAAGVFAFCGLILAAWRGGGLFLFIPGGALLLGGLDSSCRQITQTKKTL